MQFLKFSGLAFLLMLSGCVSYDCKDKQGEVLQGTKSAIVGLYVDKNEYPQAQFSKVRVFPGQKIVFAGPDNFDILFKNRKSPVDKLEFSSKNGILIIEIPKDIFEREQRSTKNTSDIKELRYQYGIRVNGKVTDPEIIVTRR